MAVLVTCPLCEGTGLCSYQGWKDGDPATQRRCPLCFGEGEISKAHATQEGTEVLCMAVLNGLRTIALDTNVFHAYVVLEALDPTEHDALTDTQKEGVKILLSCGRVDLNEGKAGRVRLWNWFGAESTTVANLTALLS